MAIAWLSRSTRRRERRCHSSPKSSFTWILSTNQERATTQANIPRSALDPLISAGIGLLLLPRTISLLKQSGHILLEGAPSEVRRGRSRSGRARLEWTLQAIAHSRSSARRASVRLTAERAQLHERVGDLGCPAGWSMRPSGQASLRQRSRRAAPSCLACRRLLAPAFSLERHHRAIASGRQQLPRDPSALRTVVIRW